MTLTTAQIIAEYNAAATTLGLKTVKKFQDRKTAERRLQVIQGQLAQHEAAQRSQQLQPQTPAKEAPSFNVIRVKDGKKVVVKEKAEKAVRQPRQFSDDKTLPALVEFFKATFGNDKNATMLREGLKKFPEATRVQFRHSAEAAGYNGLTARNLFDRVNKKG